MGKFDGQKLELASDHNGNRVRLTVGSDKFKEYYDSIMANITEKTTELDELKAVAKNMYSQLVMPLNKTTGKKVKSGKIDGEYLQGSFKVESVYELTDNKGERSDQAMLAEIHTEFAGAFTSARYCPKASLNNVTDMETFADMNIDISESNKITPAWKTTVIKSRPDADVKSNSNVKEK